jgi:hypothetical protein
MRFMVLMIPAIYQAGKGVDPNIRPDPKKIEEMTAFNNEMAKSLKMLAAEGLHPLTTGTRVSFSKGSKPVVTDGPFIEAKEVLGGYWMLEAPSKEDVVKWMQKCPADPGDVVEIRQVYEEADFEKIMRRP